MDVGSQDALPRPSVALTDSGHGNGLAVLSVESLKDKLIGVSKELQASTALLL